MIVYNNCKIKLVFHTQKSIFSVFIQTSSGDVTVIQARINFSIISFLGM